MQAEHVNSLAAKTAVGSGGVIAAVTAPSDYVSFFDRVYQFGGIVISGDDLSRSIGLVVCVLVGVNIVYTIAKDVRGRRKQRADQKKRRD